MNDKTSPNSPPLLTEQEWSALLQRKAAIQANLKTGSTVAQTCSTASPVACPGCGCGNGADEAPPAGTNRLFKPILATLGVVLVVALLLWRT